MGENGGYTPCDLNKDAGGDDIFLHISRGLVTNNPDVYTGRQLQEVAPFGYVNVRMMADIKLNDVVYFAQGDCSLDLNGHTLDRGLKEPIATGSVIEVSSSCQLTIKDSSADHSGVITGGACSGYGGGISNEGTQTITGGTITGNTAMRYGGGIWTRAESLFGIVSAGTLNIQGHAVVSGNTADGFPNDVYLDDGQKINVTGPLTEGARIGVTTDEPDATITSGYATHNGGTDPSRFFFSNSDYKLSLNGSGEVVQSAPADNWIDYRAAEFNHVDGRNIFIESEEELALLAYNVNNGNGYYNFFINLTKDLDMSAHQWTPIGTEQNKFRGCFDGRGHTINGIYVNTNSDNAGFFGYMLGVEPGWPYSRFRYIRNVNLTKANIIGGNNVGGILGFAHSQIRLDNIYCEANVIGLNNVGGFIGQSYQDPKSNGGSWIACGVCNSLFKGGVIRGTGNRGTTIGTRGQYFFISQTYYAHPGSKTDDSYDKRAYPVYVAERKGIVVQYDTLDAGVFFNDTAYYPAGTATFTLENDANHRITSVKVNGSEVGTTTGKYQITVDPAKAVAYVISVATKPATDLAGNGTAADPYLITSADDWNRVANLLRVGGLQDGDLHFKLTADISVSDRLGTPDYPFRGTLDGDGHTITSVFGSPDEYFIYVCSPFYAIHDATIQNLVVDGSIYSSAQNNGGLVGKVSGMENHIRNCVSRVSIHSNRDDDCSNGGFIGQMSTDGAHVFFEGCAFTGELVGPKACNWGGFVGWREYNYPDDYNTRILYDNYNHVFFTNCIFAPAKVDIDTSPKFSNSCVFCRSRDTTSGASYDNCYYLTNIQAADGGSQAYSISAGDNVTMEYAGATGAAYNVSNITACDTGVKFNGVHYAGEGDNVSLHLAGSPSNKYYDSDYHALAASENPYTLVMPAKNTVVSAWTQVHPTEIATEEDWNNFRIAHINGDDYAGQTATMTADIVTSAILGNDDVVFRGTFDGGGHRLTVAYGSAENYIGQSCALFSYIDDATIQNLVIDGSIYSSAQYNGSIAVRATGDNNHIRNCVSRVSMNSNRNGECANGGFIGRLHTDSTKVAFEGCTFAGEMQGSRATNWGGFVGGRTYEDNNHNMVSFDHCLFAPTKVSIAMPKDSNSRTFCRSTDNTTNGASYDNCYYLTTLQTSDGGKQAYSNTADKDVSVENAGVSKVSLSNITIYDTGVKLNDVHYAGEGDQMSLMLGYSGTIPATELGYYVNKGSLTGAANPYTLAMPNSNTHISAWKPVHPIEIASVDDWNGFCQAIMAGNDYDGETVTMTADVKAATMTGNEVRPFRGTLDGGGHTLTLAYGSADAAVPLASAAGTYGDQACAPFYRIDDATIRNLAVGGSIYSAAQYNASLAVMATGAENLIQNCISRVSINSSRNGECANGGFVGLMNTDGTHVSFEGCAFTGEMQGSQATNWGGFVGWRAYAGNNHSTLSLTGCLFAPTDVSIATPDGSNSRTFCRSSDNSTRGVSYANCYYLTTLQTADGGGQGYGFVTLPPAIGLLSATYQVSGITAYANGLKYDGRYYVDHVALADNAANTDFLSEVVATYGEQPMNVMLHDRTFYQDEGWNTLCLPFDLVLEGSPLMYAEARTLSGSTFDRSTGTLTLNFSDPVTTLTAGTPYIIKWVENYADLTISTAAEWDAFAEAVSSGTDYSEKVVALDADIEVSTMVGADGHPFRGTFNGRGHTLTFNVESNLERCAPFAFVEDASFVNLHTTGTINHSGGTGGSLVAGLLTNPTGTVTISSCRSSVAVKTQRGTQMVGGFVASSFFVGSTSKVHFTDCLFDGKLAVVNSGFPHAAFMMAMYQPASLTNCLSKNESDCFPFFASDASKPISKNCYCSYNYQTSRETLIGDMSNEQLAAALGDGWQVKDGDVIPVVRYIHTSGNVVSPVFADAIVTAVEPASITPGLTAGADGDGSVTFTGTYDPMEIGPEGDNTKLYFSANNTLFWPNGAMTFKPFRAYFQLNTAAAIKAYRLCFGDEETGIVSIGQFDNLQLDNSGEDGAWYDLSGRKIRHSSFVTRHSSLPTGIYINNGKKIVIK